MFKYTLTCCFVLFLGFHASSQKRFSTKIFIGFTATQVQGDALAGFDKAGITAGIGISRPINKKWSWGFEMAYIQKGSKSQTNPDSVNYNYYKMALHYIEVPLLLNYRSKKISFSAGPTVGVLIAGREENFSGILPIVAPFKKYEIGLTGGVLYQYSKKVSFGIRSSESLLSIRETPAYAKSAFGRFRGQYNIGLSLQIFYSFL